MTTEVRELLGDAAQSEVRPDLAERAIGGARTRRRQRFVVGGSVLAAAAVVLGVVVASGDLRTDSEPRPSDVASLPAQLPSPGGLPKLVDGTMEAASAAYVVDRQLVLVDASTGDAAQVHLSIPVAGGRSTTPLLGRNPSLALSPDGQTLIVATGASPQGSENEWLVLVDVPTGQAWLQQSWQLAPRSGTSPQYLSRMAWSPDGLRFACICSFVGAAPILWMANPMVTGDDGQLRGWPGPDLTPSQISWGTDGLAAQFQELKADWRLVPTDGALPDPEQLPPLESVSTIAPGVLPFPSVAMGHSDVGGFLAQIRGGDFWVVTASGERTVEGNLGDRPIMGALGESYFIVFTDWKGEPLGEVTRVDLEGESTLTTLPPSAALPPSATTISFASELVD